MGRRRSSNRESQHVMLTHTIITPTQPRSYPFSLTLPSPLSPPYSHPTLDLYIVSLSLFLSEFTPLTIFISPSSHPFIPKPFLTLLSSCLSGIYRYLQVPEPFGESRPFSASTFPSSPSCFPPMLSTPSTQPHLAYRG